MREMHVTVTCDNCGESTGEDGTKPGIPIMFDSSNKLTVDLCEECVQEIKDLLDPLLANGVRDYHTGKNGKDRKQMPSRPVTNCSKCNKRLSLGAALILHARAAHPDEVDDVVAATKKKAGIIS
jgi:hypothetical protein